MTYFDHAPFLAQAVAHVPVTAGKSYAITPEIDHDNISLQQVALADNWYVGGTNFQRLAFPVSDNKQVITYDSKDNPGYSDLYYYAMLKFSAAGIQGDPPTQQFNIGAGDGEYFDHFAENLSGAVLNVSWSSSQPQGVPLIQAPDGETMITLPGSALENDTQYFAELRADGAAQGLRFSIAAFNDLSQIQANVAIHVLGTGMNQGKLLGVITPGHNQDCYYYLEDPAVVLVALIMPTITTNPATGEQVFTFEIGDPEKDGVVKVRQI